MFLNTTLQNNDYISKYKEKYTFLLPQTPEYYMFKNKRSIILPSQWQGNELNLFKQ